MSREVEWQGKYIRVVRDGTWEYVERCGGVHAVVILAEHDGNVVLVEQVRVPLGNRKCLELPAGLVGDEDPTPLSKVPQSRSWRRKPVSLPSGSKVLGQFFSSPGNGR
jgi:ADP-ribose pyrophosphatase